MRSHVTVRACVRYTHAYLVYSAAVDLARENTDRTYNATREREREAARTPDTERARRLETRRKTVKRGIVIYSLRPGSPQIPSSTPADTHRATHTTATRRRDIVGLRVCGQRGNAYTRDAPLPPVGLCLLTLSLTWLNIFQGLFIVFTSRPSLATCNL